MEQPIVARAIIEILGAPKEHITKVLNEHIAKIKEELEVQYEKYAEPVPKENLFSQYVEVQIAFPKAEDLLNFCFDSMPSTIEIISPEKIEIEMTALEDLLNDFQAKLHHADMMLKGIAAQKEVLDRNALNIFHNFIKYACQQKPHTLKELSKLVGLKEEALEKFIQNMIDKGTLAKEGNQYTTNG